MRKTQLFLLAGVLGIAGAAAAFSATKNVTVVDAPKCLVIEAANEGKVAEYKDAESTLSEAGSNKPAAVPTKQWENKDTGYVIFGISMGLSAALIGTMVVLSILKKKGKKEE